MKRSKTRTGDTRTGDARTRDGSVSAPSMRTQNRPQSDFADHNKEVREVWESFHAGNPIRMPVIVDVGDRFFVLNKDTNPKNISFREYSLSPEVMFNLQKDFDPYFRNNIPGDHEMGIPEDGWNVNVDFQNYYESAWLGGQVHFPDGQVPYAKPFLNEDNKEMLFEKGIPDPFSGFMATAKEFYDKFKEWQKTTLIMGRPIKSIGTAFAGTDGIFTLACELRGADNLCVDMLIDSDYYHTLMDFLTEATIERIKAWRVYRGQSAVQKSFGFADDSIMLLSKEQYIEYVLPYHQRLVDALSTKEEKTLCHLCGDATRHFKLMSEKLNIGVFDTGFPVNHEELVKELGPEIIIQGGIKAEMLLNSTPELIEAETKRIIESVKPHTKKFIFRDANSIPPYTPVKNIEAMYFAAKKYGISDSVR